MATLGVTALFGVPGSGLSLQLITALEARGIPFFGTCHESAAAIMAGAFGRVGGAFGCCISIKGPGLANMMPGILSNAYESLPVLSLSEAYAAEANPRAHKRLNHSATLAGCAKAYAGLDATVSLARLKAIAEDEVPGPVHMDLAPQGGMLRRSSQWTQKTSSFSDALQRVRRAARPVVIAGSLSTRRLWGKALSSLRVPMLTTVAAKGVVNESAQHSAGIFTGDGKAASPEVLLLRDADLVVGLGLRNVEVLTPHTFGVPSVLFDAVGVSWGFQSSVFVTGTSDDEFEHIIEHLAEREWGADVVDRAKTHVSRLLTADDWLPGRAMEILQAALPPPTRLVVDTGAFCTVAEHLWTAADPSRFIASANGRFMGTSVPMAIGAALADAASPVLCMVGDGGIRVSIGELKLASSLQLPLLLVLLSDGRYGSIAAAPSARGLSRQAVKIPQPSWVAAIEALGFAAVEVRSAPALEAAVQQWSTRRTPMFIEAVFDAERYETMTDNVR